MPSSVVLVQGTQLQISTTAVTELNPSPAPTMVSMDCTAREINYQGGTAAEIDVTTFCSTAKEFRLGLEDPGQFTINGHWVMTDAAQAVLRTAASDKLTRLFTVVFEDGSSFSVLGFVASRSFSAAVDGVVTGTFTIRLTGAVGEVPASGA